MFSIAHIADETTSRLAIAAVSCLTPAVAWLTFLANRRDRAHESGLRQLRQLKRLTSELEVIRRWAGTPRHEQAHDPNWYDPFWTLNHFPTRQVRAFSTAVPVEEYGADLHDAVAELCVAADLFAVLVDRHNEIAAAADARAPGMRRRIRRQVPSAWMQSGAAAHLVEELERLPLSDDELTYLREHYGRLRLLHTFAIGDADTRGGLHRSWARACAAAEEARRRASARRPPRGAWVGNSLSTVLGLLGTGFLLALIAHVAAGIGGGGGR